MLQWLYGLLLCLLIMAGGLFVWKNGKVRFFAGVDAGFIRNERMLAKKIGLSIIAFGCELAILLTVHTFLIPVPAIWTGVLAVIHILHVLILGINGMQKG